MGINIILTILHVFSGTCDTEPCLLLSGEFPHIFGREKGCQPRLELLNFHTPEYFIIF